MSETRTAAIKLPLDKFSYGPDRDKVGWRAVDGHTGQKFVIFDAKVAEAIINGGDVSRDYTVQAPREAGRDFSIIGVPGVYEPEPRRGFGGAAARPTTGGGGMSNKQVALLAASNMVERGATTAHVVAHLANQLTVWLLGAEPASTLAAPAPAPVTVPDKPAEAFRELAEGIGGELSWGN